MATNKSGRGEAPRELDTAGDDDVVLERVYEHPVDEGEGYRVLVDRLWPRGMRKDAFQYDDWAKELAPSTDLRHWYDHDPAKWEEFRKRYRAELGAEAAQAELARVRAAAAGKPLVLLTATKDAAHSNAEVLAEYLRAQHA